MERTDFQKVWKTFGIIGLGCVILGLLLVLYLIRELLTPFIIAFVVVFFLSPIVDYMEGEGINRTFAVVMLILSGVVILSLVLKLTWPTIQAELNSFGNNVPVYMDKTQKGLDGVINLVEKDIGFIPKGTLGKALQQKMSDLSSQMGDVGSLIKVVKGLAMILILIPFIVFFLLKDGRKIRKMLIAYVPNKYFETFLTLFYEIDQQISNYIKGQLVDSLIVGILAIIGLYLMGIRYAFFIGAVLGIVNIISYFGPLIGLGIGGLLVLIDSGSTVQLVKLVGVFVVVRLLDDIIIWPQALSKTVHIHPLMVIIVVLLGGLVHGIWGMLLAVPLYCSVKVSFLILYRGFVEYGNW
jgi:predicted PurR-regulated permease PerM